MNEIDVQDTLINLLDPTADRDDYLESLQVVGVESFAEAGLLTRNKGLVVETDDGSQFQITIVQSH